MVFHKQNKENLMFYLFVYIYFFFLRKFYFFNYNKQMCVCGNIEIATS